VLHLLQLLHLDTAITAESLALPRLQLAAYPGAVAVTTVLERSAIIADVVASAPVAGNAVEGAGSMSKGVAMSPLRPSCHILRCWMDAQMLVIFHAMFIQTCSDWLIGIPIWAHTCATFFFELLKKNVSLPIFGHLKI
jgi:hypothetical protein